MRLYRITRPAFAHDLSGEGAAIHGGRWNEIGTPTLYCANSTALAALEVRVNLDLSLGVPNLVRVVLGVPDDHIAKDDAIYFPEEAKSRKFGTHWANMKESLCLKVASATLPGTNDSFNILVNPRHPQIDQVKILDVSSFKFDLRLF